MSDRDLLRQAGIPEDLIATATINGRPVADNPERKSRLPSGMNKTEALYAAELDWLKREGTIREYWFERVKLKLARKTYYTPDFLVQFTGGRLLFVEVKGYLRDDAAVKFKTARELFPWAGFLMVRRTKGRFEAMGI